MIVEQRTYTLKVGRVPEFLKLYEAEGLPIHTHWLGALLGYYVMDVGPLNTVVHLWGYEDGADRARRRAGLNADPAWHAFSAKAGDMFEKMESRLLAPAPFFAAQAAGLMTRARETRWTGAAASPQP